MLYGQIMLSRKERLTTFENFLLTKISASDSRSCPILVPLLCFQEVSVLENAGIISNKSLPGREMFLCNISLSVERSLSGKGCPD